MSGRKVIPRASTGLNNGDASGMGEGVAKVPDLLVPTLSILPSHVGDTEFMEWGRK